jgi:hypothetical protein
MLPAPGYRPARATRCTRPLSPTPSGPAGITALPTTQPSTMPHNASQHEDLTQGTQAPARRPRLPSHASRYRYLSTHRDLTQRGAVRSTVFRREFVDGRTLEMFIGLIWNVGRWCRPSEWSWGSSGSGGVATAAKCRSRTMVSSESVTSAPSAGSSAWGVDLLLIASSSPDVEMSPFMTWCRGCRLGPLSGDRGPWIAGGIRYGRATPRGSCRPGAF